LLQPACDDSATPAKKEEELNSTPPIAAVDATTPFFRELAAKGILTELEGWAAQTHGVVRVLSGRFGFAYMEI
jgi:hypothetical protein